jgi:pilus assembly protein Flp/PilA
MPLNVNGKEVTTMIGTFIRRLQGEDGQGLAEYALILALIAIIAIVALIFLGNQVSSIISKVGVSV